jgi:hypothetical protein
MLKIIAVSNNIYDEEMTNIAKVGVKHQLANQSL